MIVFALLAFLLLLAAAHLVTRPFLLPDDERVEDEEPAAAAEKERLLERIRELDMDYATGKLTEPDYRRLRAHDTAEAARLLQAIEVAAAAAAVPTNGSRPPGTGVAPTAPGDDALEREIAARKASIEASACPDCAAPRGPGEPFCRRCGAGLVASGGGPHV